MNYRWLTVCLFTTLGCLGSNFANAVGQVYHADALPLPLEKVGGRNHSFEQTLILAPNGHLFRYTSFTHEVKVMYGYETIYTPAAEVSLWNRAKQGWEDKSVSDVRFYPTATLTTDGRVVLAGGYTDSGIRSGEDAYEPLDSTAIWDSKSGRYTNGPILTHARYAHTATALPNGDVLITGGQTPTARKIPQRGNSDGTYLPDTATSSIELITRNWGGSITKALRPMREARSNHTATLLPSKLLLVVGGRGEGKLVDRGIHYKLEFLSGSRLASAELYDIRTNRWTPTASLPEPRMNHTATVLPDGRVLVVGGNVMADGLFVSESQQAFRSALLWNPLTATWTPTDSLPRGRAGHTATALPNGDVLISGGEDWRQEPVLELALWQRATGKWVRAGRISSALDKHATFLLPNGNVFLAGGEGSYVWTEKPGADAPGDWVPPRAGRTVTPLQDGRFLAVGGEPVRDEGSYLADIYDPASQRWSGTGEPHFPRAYHRATRLADGRVLVTGGERLRDWPAEIWDPKTQQWTVFPSFKLAPYLDAPQYPGIVLCNRSYKNGIFSAQGCGPELRGLADGRVLIGTFSEPNKATEYATGEPTKSAAKAPSLRPLSYSIRVWTPGDQPPTDAQQVDAPRMGGRMLLLGDGRLLFVGGIEQSTGLLSRNINLWDINSSRWKTAGQLDYAITDPDLRVLNAHRVLILERTLLAPQGKVMLWDDRTQTILTLPLPPEIKREAPNPNVRTVGWAEENVRKESWAQDLWQAIALDTDQIMLMTKTQTFLSQPGFQGWERIQNKNRLRPYETPIFPLPNGNAVAFKNLTAYSEIPDSFTDEDSRVFWQFGSSYKGSFAVTQFASNDKQWQAIRPFDPPTLIREHHRVRWSGYADGANGAFGFLYTPRPDISLRDYSQLGMYLSFIMLAALGLLLDYWNRKYPAQINQIRRHQAHPVIARILLAAVRYLIVGALFVAVLWYWNGFFPWGYLILGVILALPMSIPLVAFLLGKSREDAATVPSLEQARANRANQITAIMRTLIIRVGIVALAVLQIPVWIKSTLLTAVTAEGQLPHAVFEGVLLLAVYAYLIYAVWVLISIPWKLIKLHRLWMTQTIALDRLPYFLEVFSLWPSFIGIGIAIWFSLYIFERIVYEIWLLARNWFL